MLIKRNIVSARQQSTAIQGPIVSTLRTVSPQYDENVEGLKWRCGNEYSDRNEKSGTATQYALNVEKQEMTVVSGERTDLMPFYH